MEIAWFVNGSEDSIMLVHIPPGSRRMAQGVANEASSATLFAPGGGTKFAPI